MPAWVDSGPGLAVLGESPCNIDPLHPRDSWAMMSPPLEECLNTGVPPGKGVTNLEGWTGRGE